MTPERKGVSKPKYEQVQTIGMKATYEKQTGKKADKFFAL